MAAWLADNWWWLIPMALAPLLALDVFRRTKAIAAGPQPLRTMAYRTARYLLFVFATLLGVAAISAEASVPLIVAAFMSAILFIPTVGSWTIPSWARYAAYTALFFVFVMAWSPGRVPSEAAQPSSVDPAVHRVLGFVVYIALAAAFAAFWNRVWRVGTLPSVVAAACTLAATAAMVYVTSDDMSLFDPGAFAVLFFLAWMVTSLVQLRASRR